MMNTLSGKTGIMTINDPAKDGTTSGMSSNYWDVHKTFGYMSAYENAYFYASLLAYADIYDFKADNYAKNGQSAEAEKARDVAEEYRGYAAVTREKYNTLFWDEAKGRYIGGINADGERLDFGFTYVNFMAVSYGIASEAQAKQVYDWVDGDRIIEGDTSTGEDIYGKFKYAARSNTLDVSTVTDASGALLLVRPCGRASLHAWLVRRVRQPDAERRHHLLYQLLRSDGAHCGRGRGRRVRPFLGHYGGIP